MSRSIRPYARSAGRSCAPLSPAVRADARRRSGAEHGVGPRRDRQADAGKPQHQFIRRLAADIAATLPDRIADVAEYEQVPRRGFPTNPARSSSSPVNRPRAELSAERVAVAAAVLAASTLATRSGAIVMFRSRERSRKLWARSASLARSAASISRVATSGVSCLETALIRQRHRIILRGQQSPGLEPLRPVHDRRAGKRERKQDRQHDPPHPPRPFCCAINGPIPRTSTTAQTIGFVLRRFTQNKWPGSTAKGRLNTDLRARIGHWGRYGAPHGGQATGDHRRRASGAWRITSFLISITMPVFR